jgi:hypothetical protein
MKCDFFRIVIVSHRCVTISAHCLEKKLFGIIIWNNKIDV